MAPEQAPIVSIALSTRDRPDALSALLTAIEGQSLPAETFEVVIVDDASVDESSRRMRTLVDSSPLPIHLLRNSRNRGQAAGRNRAWRAARGPVIAFTDDDCQPIPSWLEAGLMALDAGPAVVVGATKPHPDQRHLLRPLARTMEVRDAKVAPACNVFYLRSDLEAVDGFDESFGRLGGEDTDLAWRVHRALGRELRFCSEAVVYHDVRPRTFRQAARDAERWAGIAKVASRHPGLARRTWPGSFYRRSHPWLMLAIAGIALAPVLPLTLLLVVPWLRVRVFTGRPGRTWLVRFQAAPKLFALDLIEIWVLAKASFRFGARIL